MCANVPVNQAPPKFDGAVVYEEIRQEAVDIMAKHKLLKQLFGSAKRAELLNDSAAVLFDHVLRGFVALIIAGVCRLIDHDGRQLNASVTRLIEHARALGREDVANDLTLRLERLRTACAGMRKVRHKLLSHKDLAIATKSAPPLPSITYREIDHAVAELHALLNAYSLPLFRSEYFHDVALDGDGDDLIRLLEVAARVKSEERTRVELELAALQRGEIPERFLKR